MEIFSASLALCAGISPVNGEFPSQSPVTQSFMFSLIWAWTNGWVNNRNASDLRRHHAHYDVAVLLSQLDCVHSAGAHWAFIKSLPGFHIGYQS